MIINNILKDYASLLCLYWSKVKELDDSDTTESFKNDWLQANWELIVERQLGDSDLYLEVYGDGADCNGESSRVLFSNKRATHNIILKSNSSSGNSIYDLLGEKYIDDRNEKIIFQRFVTMREDSWYYEEPPFDMIEALYRDEIVIVKFSAISAELNVIS